MRIAIVTDAWKPQVNGVVTVLTELIEGLAAAGHAADVIEPSEFRRIRCPIYVDVELAWRPSAGVARRLDSFGPDALHIATEGPLGCAARAHALRNRWSFTTAFHSRFPEFIAAATGLPAGIGYAWLRRFHAPSSGVMVPSSGTLAMLERRGFRSLRAWSHGIDVERFTPHGDRLEIDAPRPRFLFVGRVAPEKNIEAFLDLDLPGSKIVAGGGPALERLRRRHPEVRFLGPRPRESLPALYRAADVFVHPSRTDTFGLVMLEALACGTPVAAFRVPGPLDVVGESAGGVLDDDLRRAALTALALDRAAARARALAFDRDRVRDQFLSWLAPIVPRANAGAPRAWRAASRAGL
ncbi:MAG TPA: glycosyltransferase family 1 protein [Caldimonas sp.]|nr:glycosyltransferase family 1 protein [Caldimonas sp.]